MSAGRIKFDEFELDCDRYQLLRSGTNVKLEKIPMELLILLVSKNGHLATRQEIVERLWGSDVFVDTEHGINTAVRKVRQVLGDDPEQPRFVQTVTGKGYRFIAECVNGRSTASAPQVTTATSAEATPLPEVSGTASASKRGWRWLATAVLVCLLVGALLGFNLGGLRDRVFARNRVGPIHSLAVLPLANLSGDPSQEYYADGMTDELITALARNRSLRVVSRTSAMQYKGSSQPLREIAQNLGVDGILEGSVNRSGDHVHVNLQLIYAPTDTHIWAESYDRDLSTALSLPSELSRTIAEQAKVDSAPQVSARYINPEAHDAYLKGHYLWFAGDYGECRKSFEKAIQLQPDYAPAWSGLSAVILDSGPGEPGEISMREVVDQAEAAARRAVELDDSYAGGHHAMAAVYLFGKWDWEHADAESRRSLELDPNFSEAHHLRSYILFVMNRQQEALQEQKRATEIEPFERPWALGRAYYRMRQYDAAIEEFRMRALAGPSASWVHRFLSRVYGFKGMDKESVLELEEDTRLHRGEQAAAAIQRAYERGGRKAVLQLQLDQLKTRSRHEYVSPFELAEAYAALGMKEEALRYLENAYREHATDLVFLQQEPVFDFLHTEPRYRTIVKNMDMPPAY